MKTLAIVTVAIAYGNSAASTGTFLVDKFIDVAARRLQSELPACASDGLVEARRGSGKWTYAFWLGADKTSGKEVRISLKQLNASSSQIDVEVVAVRGGLLFDNEDTLAAESLEWTTRINRLLDSVGGVGACARVVQPPM